MQPEVLPDGRGADERDAAQIVRLHELQRPDRDDAGQRGELFHPVASDANLDAVVGRAVVGDDSAAEAFDAAAHAVMLALQLAVDTLLLVPVELAAGVSLVFCNGISGKLHHDRDGGLAYAQRRKYRCHEAGAVAHSLGAHRARVRASQNAKSQRQRRDGAN